MALKKSDISETPKDFFDRIRAHHREQSGELKNHPIDFQLVRHEQFKEDHKLRCGYCNSSYMDDSVSPYECKKCWINRMTWIMGEDEMVEKLYNEQYERRMKFADSKLKLGDKKVEVPQEEVGF